YMLQLALTVLMAHMDRLEPAITVVLAILGRFFPGNGARVYIFAGLCTLNGERVDANAVLRTDIVKSMEITDELGSGHANSVGM
ncbi:hypothetical protein, partial [Enterococcus lactis]|uniref:hypothetical protein n=1 Tax=Enterococcus lactis TaxID=357441 RepID=UPI001C7D7D12